MKKIAAFLALTLFLPVLAPPPACQAGGGVALAADIRTVRQVSDGDTLVLDNGEKVRLIGVDTPELHDDSRNRQNARRNQLNAKMVNGFAVQAKRFTGDRVLGRTVRLEYDWQRQDKYGRTLAYVYRQPDDYFLNAAILQEGYGFAYTFFPFKYSADFRGYEKRAREKKLGLWK